MMPTLSPKQIKRDGNNRGRRGDDGTRRLDWRWKHVRRLDQLARKLKVPFHSRHAKGME